MYIMHILCQTYTLICIPCWFSEYSNDRLGTSDHYSMEKSYTSTHKSPYDTEDIRVSSTLKKPIDQYYVTEKSTDHKFRSSLDKYQSAQNSVESDLKFRRSLDREESQFRRSTGREESGFKLRSMDHAESRIRSALEKADANLRNVEKDESSKYNFDSNLRDMTKDDMKYNRYDDKFSGYSKSLDERSYERKSYENERKSYENEKVRSELYRTMPDGGVSDKESYQSKDRYERSKTPERLSYNTLNLDSERLRYDKEKHVPSVERDLKLSTDSYESSSTRRSKSFREKSKGSYPSIYKCDTQSHILLDK